jgi:hypothetical protein
MHPHRNTSISLCELSLEEASDITSKEFEMEVLVTNRLHPAKRELTWIKVHSSGYQYPFMYIWLLFVLVMPVECPVCCIPCCGKHEQATPELFQGIPTAPIIPLAKIYRCTR